MTSLRQSASNWRNARKSTGPRTEAGKSTSAANAVKHGLSSQPVFDVATEEKIAALADDFLGGRPFDEKAMVFARAAAEAQVMVERVAEARRQVWSAASRHPVIATRGMNVHLNDVEVFAEMDDELLKILKGLMSLSPHRFADPFEDDYEKEADILRFVSQKLTKLIRYERRAANQRDKALRALTEAMCQSEHTS